MNLNRAHWTKGDYEKFQEYLITKVDISYKEFHTRLLNGTEILGIRIPELKQMAKEIGKGNYMEFLSLNSHVTYEERTIHGLILGYVKIPFPELLTLVDEFIPYIDNWATNDVTCANLKAFKTNQEVGFKKIQTYLESSNVWEVRFGLVLLLDFYINDTYVDEILRLSQNIKCEEYYVKMANAWLLSICYIKYPKKMMPFLKENQLDDWTYNKTISKICDSLRVPKDEKEQLKKLKRS